MLNLVGRQLGSYKLLRVLGEGGFAEVYLGEHLHLKSKAAIKVLHTSLAKEDQQDFLAEAQTVAKLRHPHIVGILEFGIQDSIPYLVMDYAPQGTLRARYPRGERLPLEAILPYIRQVADALQYAHDHKIVHRDIKPENMLLDAQGQILLSDFGIATTAHSSRSQSVEEVVGTIFYMAPEQLMGKPRMASDQYALAVVIYEWLTGMLPFQGAFAEIASQQLFEPPPPLREKVPSLSPALEAVLLKALAKDPKERFASVQDFAAALERASQLELSSSLPSQPGTFPAQNPDVTSLVTRLDPNGTRVMASPTERTDNREDMTLPSDTANALTLPTRKPLKFAVPLVSAILAVLLLSSFVAANVLGKRQPTAQHATTTTTAVVTIQTPTPTATVVIPPPVIVKVPLSSSGGPAPQITQFPLPAGETGPIGITAGPDGNLWFVESDSSSIGRITPAGNITSYPLSHPYSSPYGITLGLDGNLWFTEQNPAYSSGWIGSITPAGAIHEYATPGNPRQITTGPDGNLWFTSSMDNSIGRMTPSGTFTMFPLPGEQQAESITTGPDHNLWFTTESPGGKIGRITPDGAMTLFPVPNITPGGDTAIAAGPDGSVWFVMRDNSAQGAEYIGRITLGGAITEFLLPTSNNYVKGITAGPDGNVWFTALNTNLIGRLTPTGVLSEFHLPARTGGSFGIAAGPNDTIWFTKSDGDRIGRIILGH